MPVLNYTAAVNDFRDARRKASLEVIMSRLRGRAIELLPYEEVRRLLGAVQGTERGLQDIPLDAIVGSVGRYTDFTRSFLPLQDSDCWRWTRVRMATDNPVGVPPIEVYQVGEVYFVKDGNHRVSVARQLETPTIQAYVIEIKTRAHLTPDSKLDDLILEAEYADFIARTHLDEIRPDANLKVTAPGKYRELEEHIYVHHYYMGLDQRRDVTYAEAVGNWYDKVYLPVVNLICEIGLLRDFPNRTETDMYLWLAEYRVALEEMLGWSVPPEMVAQDLAKRFSTQTRRVFSRLWARIKALVMLAELESGPPPGAWREWRLTVHREDRLFSDVVVGVNGMESGWQTLTVAFEIARREEGRVWGLHVISPKVWREKEISAALQTEFEKRCDIAGVTGRLAVETGVAASRLIERARWGDLLVVNLAYPPGLKVLAKLKSGFRTLLHRSPCPLLAVPSGTVSPLKRILLAYNGSPKAREALFVTAYLAARWPDVSVIVVTVQQGNKMDRGIMDYAGAYLESYGIQATCVFEERGSVVTGILSNAETYNCDLLVMGGYSHGVVLELLLGSALGRVLRESRWPILICR
ncbi:MAG: universal stress protein [Anaerolineae bacterium]|nr:universal stress protein [Anaerolineae bacterium]